MSSVKNLLPHREPFLFVDEIVITEEKRIVAKREIRPDEFYFKGHYPGNPVMPGVLLCEAMYQTGALLMASLAGEGVKGTPVVTRSNNVKFKRMVRPGDVMMIDVQFVEKISNAYCFNGRVRVADKLAASCEFICTLVQDE